MMAHYKKIKAANRAEVEIISNKTKTGMLKDAECVNLVMLALKGDINIKFSGQIFHTQLLSVVLSM